MDKKTNLKNLLVTLMTLLAAMTFFGLPAQAALYSGSGTQEDPFDINTPAKLNDIGNNPSHWSSYFILTADINLIDYNNFNIIGNDVNAFTGKFDGNDHTVSNFTYTTIDEDFIGLFRYLGSSGEIKDIGLINADVNTGMGYCLGSLVGYNLGTISNCYATGEVSGDDCVGGLVGVNSGSGTISNCYAVGNAAGENDVGGLVGNNWGTVSNCFTSGNVTGILEVGGLVGRSGECIISNCFATCNVTGGSWVGGLVGVNHYSVVSNCYATGTTTGDGVGGLVGINMGLVSNCYASVSISASSRFGGFAGQNDGIISASFWDTQTSDQENGVGGGSSLGLKGRTTSQMQTMSTFFGWGCEPTVWTIDVNDYPHLVWEAEMGEPISPLLSDLLEGTGTEADPFLIHSDYELDVVGRFACEWDKHFKLVSDIDLSAWSTTEPNIIGFFTGVFDGNDHTISNFTLESPKSEQIGLFRRLENPNGELKNLTLIDPNIEGYSRLGSLVGWLEDGTITACGAENGNISGTLGTAGGLVGGNLGTISNCYATVTVHASYEGVGGLVGLNHSGTVSNCYATGDVTGNECVGGLVGYNYESTISNCYSAGSVDGNDYTAGLIGCDDLGLYKSCFWDSDVNPDVNGIGNGADPNVIGESTANMQSESTFSDAGWDFVDIWRICEGTNYPKLQLLWSTPVGDFVCPDGVDFIDFSILASAWLTEYGQPFYNDECDISLPPDDVIDEKDLDVFCNNWLAGK